MWLSSKNCADATSANELTPDQRPDGGATVGSGLSVGLADRVKGVPSMLVVKHLLLLGSLKLSGVSGSFIKAEN